MKHLKYSFTKVNSYVTLEFQDEVLTQITSSNKMYEMLLPPGCKSLMGQMTVKNICDGI